jgi:RNA polymerase sigma-70 factor (ECF subfamily)
MPGPASHGHDTEQGDTLMAAILRIATPAELDKAGDAELVFLARQGVAAAFRAVMERNNRRLFRVARSVLKNDADAEDAVQETYLRAFANLDSYAGAAALSTWLTSIALNEALGRLRRRRTMVDIDEVAGSAADSGEPGGRLIPFPLAQPATSDPEHTAARAEIQHLLERAIDDLPDSFRMTFVLRFVEQLSVEETAVCLGVPEETVKTRVYRAKRLLRQALGEQLASTLVDTFPFAGARCARISDTVMRRLGVEGAPPDPT